MADIPVKNDNIYFKGTADKNDVILFVDAALKKSGDFGVYGDLSDGIAPLSQDFAITIIERDDLYELDIAPVSGDGGHDFSFTIDKKTGKLSDVDVGEILPEPDLDIDE